MGVQGDLAYTPTHVFMLLYDLCLVRVCRCSYIHVNVCVRETKAKPQGRRKETYSDRERLFVTVH